MNIDFSEVNTDDFSQIYNDMLLQFPKEELKTYEEFIGLLKYSPEYKVFHINADKDAVGYAAWLIDEEMKFLWLDYIAIYKNFHSCGFGSKSIKNFIKNYSSFKYCFFEVEKPLTEQAIKRQKFYKNLGCQNTGMRYFFPNNYKELEMDLLYYSISGEKPDNAYINSAVRKVHKIIHKV